MKKLIALILIVVITSFVVVSKDSEPLEIKAKNIAFLSKANCVIQIVSLQLKAIFLFE